MYKNVKVLENILLPCFYQDCPDAALDTVVEIIHRLNDNQKAEVIRSLSLLTTSKDGEVVENT